MRSFDIYMEGYEVTGNSMPTRIVMRKVEASNAEEAVKQWVKRESTQDPDFFTYWDEDRKTYWGCSVFGIPSNFLVIDK